MKKIILILGISYLLLSCASTKQTGYSYTVTLSAVTGNESTDFSKTEYISYKKCLIEFINTLHFDQESTPTSSTYSQRYDTAGLYVIINKHYYEFDKFSNEAKLIKKGDLIDKELGVHLSQPDSLKNNTNLNLNSQDYKNLVDTTINGIKQYYFKIKGLAGQDSVMHRIILVKNPSLNTSYTASGIIFPNKKYNIIGVHSMNLKNGDAFIQNISSLKNLTQDEILICESLISKIK